MKGPDYEDWYPAMGDAEMMRLNRECMEARGADLMRTLWDIMADDWALYGEHNDEEQRRRIIETYWPIYVRDVRRFGPRIREWLADGR